MSETRDDDVWNAAALAVQGRLPIVHMRVIDDGCALHAEGTEPYPWQATADDRHRLRVWAGSGLPIVADVTVHRSGEEPIEDEIQHIATGLVLSALRACEVRADAIRRAALPPRQPLPRVHEPADEAGHVQQRDHAQRGEGEL